MMFRQKATLMRLFKARSQLVGAEYVRPSRYDEICCAVIIYPMPDGGIFNEVTVDWYTSPAQAERHAADWRRHGHTVEVVPAEEC